MESIDGMVNKKELEAKVLKERNRVRVVGPQMPRPLKDCYYGRAEALDWVLKLLQNSEANTSTREEVENRYGKSRETQTEEIKR